MLRNGDERRYLKSSKFGKFLYMVPDGGQPSSPPMDSARAALAKGRNCGVPLEQTRYGTPSSKLYIATVAKCAMVTLRTERDVATKTAWRL